ncbi:hypothetical protein AB7M37_005432 [Sinorhizobium fredii]
MLLQWTILYRELVSQQRKKTVDAFADPLDGPEWEGFGWFVKWIEKSAERRSAAARRGKGPLDAADRTKCLPQSHGPLAGRSIGSCAAPK